LPSLARAGLLEPEAALGLREGYVFLRKVEHYLQVFDDRQTHTLPVEESRLEHLARCLLGIGVSRGAFLERLEQTRSRVQAEIERFLAAG
jgi:glutamate-ammonia-ligase adenylyltransferase